MAEWLEREKIEDFDSMKGEIKLKDFNCPLLIFSHLPNEIIVQSWFNQSLNHGERVTIYFYLLILYTLLRTFEIIGLPKQCKNYHIQDRRKNQNKTFWS